MPNSYIPDHIRLLVEERANGFCEYCICTVELSTSSYTMEHIQPTSKGGSDEMDNLAFACGGCNGRKANRVEVTDPIEKTLVRLFNPRKDEWKKHFRWNEDFSKIEGTSAVGRATVAALALNRRQTVNVRKQSLPDVVFPPRYTLPDE